MLFRDRQGFQMEHHLVVDRRIDENTRPLKTQNAAQQRVIDALVASYASFGEVGKAAGEPAWTEFTRNLIESHMTGLKIAIAGKFNGRRRVMAQEILQARSHTDMAMHQL